MLEDDLSAVDVVVLVAADGAWNLRIIDHLDPYAQNNVVMIVVALPRFRQETAVLVRQDGVTDVISGFSAHHALVVRRRQPRRIAGRSG